MVGQTESEIDMVAVLEREKGRSFIEGDILNWKMLEKPKPGNKKGRVFMLTAEVIGGITTSHEISDDGNVKSVWLMERGKSIERIFTRMPVKN